MDRSKAKKLIALILVVAALLGASAIGITYYYYNIQDVTPSETDASGCCGCYWVSPSTGLTSCTQATPISASDFQLGTINNASSCSVNCANKTGGEEMKYAGPASESGTGDAKCSAFSTQCKEDGFTEATFKESSNSCFCSKPVELLGCSVADVSCNISCVNLSVTDSENNILEPPYHTRLPIKIKATFRDTGSEAIAGGFKLLINGKNFEIPLDSEQVSKAETGSLPERDNLPKYLVTQEFSEFGDAKTLNIQAFSLNNADTSSTSVACQRTFSLETPTGSSCSQLDVATDIVNNKTVIRDITLKTNNISAEATSVILKISFDGKFDPIETIDVKDKITDDGVLVLDKAFLENETNFKDLKAFPVIGDYNQATLPIATQIIVDETAITSSACTDTINILLPTTVVVPPPPVTVVVPPPPVTVVVPPPPTTPTCLDGCFTTGEQCDPSASPTSAAAKNCQADPNYQSCSQTCTTLNTSNFTIVKSGSKCVERVVPNNTALFKITVTNDELASDVIKSVKDKLPLGFIYIAGSSKINGTPITDAGTVTVNTVGNSQEIIWETAQGWTVASKAIFTIEFSATAGPQAITGSNLNEAIVTPVNAPANPASVRTEFTFKVEQSCTTPDTGILDSSSSKILLGFTIVVIALVFYTSNMSEEISSSLLSSGTITKTHKAVTHTSRSLKERWRLLVLRLTYPHKYFEEVVIKNAEEPKKKKPRK